MRALLILIPFFLMACDQDPLQGQPDHIRNATPPELKVEEDHGYCPPDALIVEMKPGIANFTEGVTSEVAFEGRVACRDESAFNLEIKRLPVDASFDPSTGIFTWAPPEYFLKGSAFHTNITVEVTISTPTGKTETRPFNLNVFRNVGSTPEIIKVGNIVGLREGGTAEIEVSVQDPDAADGMLNTGKKPVLTFVPSQNVQRDASSFVYLKSGSTYRPNPRQDDKDPTIWHYTLIVDLKNREVTTSQTDMEFGVKAVSAFGEPSLIEFISFVAETDISKPVFTIKDAAAVDVVEGERAIVNFQVYSPRGDGQLSVNFDNCSLPGGAECSCDNSSDTIKNCSIKWVPRKGGIFTSSEVRVTATNRHFNRVDSLSTTVRNRFNVLSAGTP